jgi:hypothetical protein
LGNRIVEFIPVRLLKKSSTTLENWEIALLDAARKLAMSLNLVDVASSSPFDADADGADALETLGSALPNFTFSFNTKLTFKAND